MQEEKDFFVSLPNSHVASRLLQEKWRWMDCPRLPIQMEDGMNSRPSTHKLAIIIMFSAHFTFFYFNAL